MKWRFLLRSQTALCSRNSLAYFVSDDVLALLLCIHQYEPGSHCVHQWRHCPWPHSPSPLASSSLGSVLTRLHALVIVCLKRALIMEEHNCLWTPLCLTDAVIGRSISSEIFLCSSSLGHLWHARSQSWSFFVNSFQMITTSGCSWPPMNTLCLDASTSKPMWWSYFREIVRRSHTALCSDCPYVACTALCSERPYNLYWESWKMNLYVTFRNTVVMVDSDSSNKHHCMEWEFFWTSYCTTVSSPWGFPIWSHNRVNFPLAWPSF